MKKILALVALFFAFASTSAIAKNDYGCERNLSFFQVDQKVDHLELLFITAQ